MRRTLLRFALIILGAVLMAFNLNTFVLSGNLLPGGFTGIVVFIQNIFSVFFGISLPYSPLFFVLNAVPAVICFRLVGKKFTLYSALMVVLSGLLTDFMPESISSLVVLDDPLLCAVFGGILAGVSVVLCLYADASAGGTDFIAIAVSERYKKDAWNQIFAGNCVLLFTAGIIFNENGVFNMDLLLYSIIFQFAMTSVLNTLYRAYQQKTMLIVTSSPTEVYDLIREKTNHAATSLSGTGLYGGTEKTVLYSVVYSNEVAPLIRGIRNIDPSAFINIVKTEQINGNFFSKAKD